MPRGLVTSALDPDDWPLRARVAVVIAAGAHGLCWTVKSPQAEAEARKVAENVTFEGYLAAQPG